MSSRWTKFISKSGKLRVVAIDAGAVIDDLAKRHELSQQMKQGMGDAILAGLLLAASQKAGERVNVSIQGSGVWRQAVVDTYPEGFARAFISPGELGDWKNPTRGPWGNRLLTVLYTKHAEGQTPYSGTVALQTGFLDQDLTYYWQQSEQLPSNIAFSKDSRHAIMVQAIAGNTPEDVKLIADCGNELRKLVETDVTKLASSLKIIFPESQFSILEDTPLEFRCNCSQERVEQALLLTGVEDLKYLISDRESIDTKCDFCNAHYQITRKRVEELIRKSQGH